MIAYVIVSFPFEYLVNLLMGFISGVGVQDTATIPTIICYTLVSIPSSYVFTFTYKLGISGLFYGCALGDFALCIIYAHLIANIDLEVQLKVIKEEFMDNAKADFVTS
jgi:Na+-driven multidrug efflux pump